MKRNNITEAREVISSLSKVERYYILDYIRTRLAATHSMEVDESVTKALNALKAANTQKRAIATITPSGLIEERPDVALKVIDAFKENRTKDGRGSRNILIVSDMPNKTKEGYIRELNAQLTKYARRDSVDAQSINIEEAYRVITYEEMQGYVGEVTKDNAVNKARALVQELMPQESLRDEDILFIGTKELFEREIEFAWIVNGLLEGKEEAVTSALKLLGRTEGSVDMDLLRNKVIDLRRYAARETRAYRKAMREVKRAL